MKMDPTPDPEDTLRPEYDLSQLKGGVRGKYSQRYQAGTNLVLLTPEVRAAFPTSKSVNEALKLLLNLAKQQVASTN
jgi:hypothetical protein